MLSESRDRGLTLQRPRSAIEQLRAEVRRYPIHLGIPLVDAYSALADATAAAHLLRYFLDEHRPTPWPSIDPIPFSVTLRGAARAGHVPLLERLAHELPHSGGTGARAARRNGAPGAAQPRALGEGAGDLVTHTAELGIGRATARNLHIAYFEALARLAWADRVLTDA